MVISWQLGAYRENLTFGDRLRAWRRCYTVWRGRRRQRAALATLDARLLDDIGVDRQAALREAAKPFWRA